MTYPATLNGTALSEKVSLQTIQPLVDRVAKSGIFGASERQVALLSYLVNEELSGRGEALKAYSIGTDVLGRGTRFDPAQDAIVRVEIGRLRKSLDLYFATVGREEPLRIVIEKGNYRPHFIQNTPPPSDPDDDILSPRFVRRRLASVGTHRRHRLDGHAGGGGGNPPLPELLRFGNDG